MKVDIYERFWMWGAAVMIISFLAAIVIASVTQAMQPPSHMETIDPATVFTDSEFANPGTLMVGKKIEPPSFDFAIPVEGQPEKKGLWDRFGLWTILAVVLILMAYGYPILHLLGMERFGSVGFKPF